jgi:hypothetical protein
MIYYATCIVEVSGAPIGSKAFARIWRRPYLVDQLLAIHEQRKADQRHRDEWQFRALVMADDAATVAFNLGVAEEHRVESRMALRFPNTGADSPKKDIEADFAAQTASIFEAERRRRAEREKKKGKKG